MERNLLDEINETMHKSETEKWYDAKLAGTPQNDTVRILAEGVRLKEISIETALHIAIVTGLQWFEEFKEGNGTE